MRSPVPLALTLALGALALGATGASCSSGERPAQVQPVELPPPDVRLLVVTDPKGYLEPCGCTSRPLGGIDKLAARVARLRREAPTVLVVAGDLFFDGANHGVDLPGAEAQELWKAETLVDVWNRLGVAAATPGHLDLGHGPDTLRALAERARFPLLAAGLDVTREENGPSPLRNAVVREARGVKIGIFGVSEMEGPAGDLPPGVAREASVRDAARAAAAEVKREGAQIVVALVRGSRRTARQVATSVPEVDFVVQAGLDLAEAIPPVDAGGAWLVHGGRQGQGLLVVDLYRGRGDSFRDLSTWTRDVQKRRLEEQMRELRGRIAAWERDDSVSASDLEQQRARLREMESEIDRLVGAPARGEGPAFSARWEELAPDDPGDAQIAALVDRYDRRVNRHNARIFADLRPPPVAEGQPSYVGSAQCRSCHEAAYAWWQTTKHGIAYSTLVERDKQFNLSCVGCHVTGYNQPGGSTVTHNEGLINVGCESCHGPGSAHVAAPEAAGLVARDTPESTCVGCHNEEHSDLFEYRAYRSMLIAPGHGLPARGGS